jgi:hypothetical protein
MVFENFDRWRKHPDIHVNLRKDFKHLWPGFGIGLAIFTVYLGLEKAGLLGKKHGHGHGHGHHDSHGNHDSHKSHH